MVELKQTLALKQTLSPQQILLSTLLQLPILALEQKVKMELEQNPVIEEDSEMAQEELEEEVQEFGGGVERDMVPDGEEEEREKEEGVDEKEIEWENILNAEDDFEPQILRVKDEE
ncbi:MAG: RNA polymerase sigma-54 factor, partial [Fidelibacterota bacterium]